MYTPLRDASRPATHSRPTSSAHDGFHMRSLRAAAVIPQDAVEQNFISILLPSRKQRRVRAAVHFPSAAQLRSTYILILYYERYIIYLGMRASILHIITYL